MDEIELKIKETLNDVNAWQRVPTSLNGIFLVKTPQKVGKETILVEINPKYESGKLLKRRGLFLKNTSELQKFIRAMNNEKLYNILSALENISGEKEEDNIEPIDLWIYNKNKLFLTIRTSITKTLKEYDQQKDEKIPHTKDLPKFNSS